MITADKRVQIVVYSTVSMNEYIYRIGFATRYFFSFSCNDKQVVCNYHRYRFTSAICLKASENQAFLSGFT